MKEIHVIIFDLGGVLIDWNPKYVFDEHYFDSVTKRDHFLEHICTLDWNEQQDAGYPIAKAVEEKVAAFPEWEKAIRDYYDRWPDMLKGPIGETVEIFRELKKKKGLKFYALTNWSAELFPIALERYDFLHWFDGIVVSGVEKMRKPSPGFYKLLLERYDLKEGDVIFIDDNLRNIKAAEALGFKSVHFQFAGQLKEVLAKMDLL